MTHLPLLQTLSYYPSKQQPRLLNLTAVRATRLILRESSSYATDVVGNLPELLPTPGHPRLVDASHRIAVTRIELKIKTSLVQTSLRTAKNHLTLNLA